MIIIEAYSTAVQLVPRFWGLVWDIFFSSERVEDGNDDDHVKTSKVRLYLDTWNILI